MQERFYLACFRDNVGGNIAFHAIKGHGYTTDLRLAQVYTREEAQQAWEGARSYDQPISASHLDRLSVEKVDCQVLPYETHYDSSVTEWLAFRRGAWSGNDVYWRTTVEGRFARSLDVNAAILAPVEEVLANAMGEDWVYVPKALAMAKKRPTVSMSLFNPRVMVQGAGLKKPAWLKREQRRKGHTKARFNCTGCGKIHWQDDPYTFHGCRDELCSGFKPRDFSYY